MNELNNTTSLPLISNSTMAPGMLILGEVTLIVYKILLPIICIFGISGNSMALLLIRTNFQLRRLPSNFYLMALALVSTTFLCSVFLMWLELVLKLPIYDTSPVGCKILTFIAHFSDFCCIWIIVAISTDRMLLLSLVKWRRKVWGMHLAQRVILAILVVATLGNLWVFFIANVHKEKCLFFVEHEEYYNVFHTVETVVSYGIPAIVVCVVNTIAIYKYKKYRKLQSNTEPVVRFRGSNGSTDQTMIPINVVDIPLLQGAPRQQGRTLAGMTAATATQSTLGRNSGCVQKPLRPSDLKLTKTVLTLTTTFLVLNLPSYFYRLLSSLVVDMDTLLTVSFHSLLRLLVYVLYYVHFAVLFFLYIFWSPQMKKELKPMALKLLECYCFKTVPDFGYDPPADDS